MRGRDTSWYLTLDRRRSNLRSHGYLPERPTKQLADTIMSTPYLPHRPNESPQLSRILPDSLVPAHNGVTVWWSNIRRDGEWILPRLFRIFTCMGNVELDLTRARLGPGISEIDIRCIFANVEITVPPDIRVDADGEGLAGNFEVKRIGEVPVPPADSPILRISGTAYFGSVTVNIMGTVGPGWKDKIKAWTARNS